MKIAVVLFNLGGPDSLEAVEPFLFNLFNDPAIIGAPGPIRWLLAKLISKRRAPVARDIYAEMGGSSPLLRETESQGWALEDSLQDLGEVRVFIAMRYWHPMADETAAQVAAFAPDEVVLLPLYPQYSGTTSGSSLADWRRAAAKAGVNRVTHGICCYNENAGFIRAQAELIRPHLEAAAEYGAPRLLLSAHGLPKKVVDAGDPYQWQVEQTARAVVQELAKPDLGWPNLDWVVCYQSRVGPLEWIGPSTEDEIRRAAAEGRPLVVAPIAFVSEHSETLVELDIEYGEMALESGVPAYERAPTVGIHPAFIAALADLVRAARTHICSLDNLDRKRLCPAAVGGCPNGENW